MRTRLALALSLLAAIAGRASATVYQIHPTDDLFTTLSGLVAGDEVIVFAGTYVTPGFYQVNWAGTAGAPIVIHANPGDVPIIQGEADQNVINVSGSYFTLDGFEITGGSHGIRMFAVDHATLSNLLLHGLGDVGISCNLEPNNCDSVTIFHNEIYDTGHDGTGEGMYLGCNNAACLFTNGTVQNNYVHDLGGAQGDGIEIKEGAYNNDVADNVIVRSQYPGITMYGYAGTQPPNIVERNLVWHTTQDNGIQVVGQIIVRNNIVIDAFANGIQSKASQDFVPHDVSIVNNTVVATAAAGICLKTNDWAGQTGQVMANNAAYCDGGTAIDINGGGGTDLVVAANIGLGTNDAATGFTLGVSAAADLGDPATGVVFPPAGSALIGAASATYAPADDFNAMVRGAPPDVGAYQYAATGNPGWVVSEGFKGGVAVNIDGAMNAGDDPVTGGDNPSHAGCGCQTGHESPAGLAPLALAFLLVRRGRRRRDASIRSDVRAF